MEESDCQELVLGTELFTSAKKVTIWLEIERGNAREMESGQLVNQDVKVSY